MKISEVIKQLEELKEKHGDVNVVTRHQESNELYSFAVFAEVASVEFGPGENDKPGVIIA